LAQKLTEQGFKKVWALKGGFDAWRDAGLPVEPKSKAA
jgi:rhodanese-related sulfurtransferase